MSAILAVLALLSALVQSPGPTGVAGTASIRGSVTDKVSGQPMPRVEVRLHAAEGNSPPASTRTGEDGRFVFSAVPPGRYVLGAEASPFRAGHVEGFYTTGSAPFTILTVKAGDERTAIDIALPRAYAISGRVLDQDGAPAARLRMSARSLDGGATSGFDRVTDDRGRFRIFGLAPGRYVVCVDLMRMITTARMVSPLPKPLNTCHPSAATPEEGEPVTIRAADVDGVDITLLRSRTFTISGIVVGSSGQPASGPMVDLKGYSSSGTAGYSASADAGGRFLLPNVLPGIYGLRATLDGTATPAEAGANAVVVGSADVTDVVLTLSKTRTVSGRIVFEGTSTSPPRDPNYGPMLVAALFAGPIVSFDHGNRTVVSPDMTFEFKALFGRRVLAVDNLPSGWVVKRITYGDKDATDEAVDFETGGGELLLVADNRGAILSGRVLDDGGNPVRGRVLMIPADRALWLAFQFPRIVSGAERTGAFAFRAERAGEYVVVAVDPAEVLPQRMSAAFFERILKAGQTITLSESERRTVDLRITKLPEQRQADSMESEGLNRNARRYAHALLEEFPAFRRNFRVVKNGDFETWVRGARKSTAGVIGCQSFRGDVWVRFSPGMTGCCCQTVPDVLSTVRGLMAGERVIAVVMKGKKWVSTTLRRHGTKPSLRAGETLAIYSWVPPKKRRVPVARRRQPEGRD
jgi:Carboxypeptidase regulatory-like domain